MTFGRLIRLAILVIITALLVPSSALSARDQQERVRAFTRDLEFDYVSWTLKAWGVKINQSALVPSQYLPADTRRQVVLDYLDLVRQTRQTQGELNAIFSNPEIEDPEAAAAPVLEALERLNDQRNTLGPLAESVIQSQISATVAELELTVGGQPVPAVLYRTTPLPTALIVSPRDIIRQDKNISFQPDLRVDLRAELENKGDQELKVSSLV